MSHPHANLIRDRLELVADKAQKTREHKAHKEKNCRSCDNCQMLMYSFRCRTEKNKAVSPFNICHLWLPKKEKEENCA